MDVAASNTPTRERATRPAGASRRDADLGPHYRYGVVFVLVLGLIVFLIAVPEAGWSRSVSIVIGGSALAVAVMTARARQSTRRGRAAALSVITGLVVVGSITGIAPRAVVSGYGALVSGAVPAVIVAGVLRLLRKRGVTLQAVAGALVIYLCVGLVFAWIISVIAQVSAAPYFAQHTDGTIGDRAYFSFTTLTTTGYGDLSPGTAVGHALAVVEMITGQLYLATVIGVLIGSLVGRSRSGVPDERYEESRGERHEAQAETAGGRRRLLS